jgi:hypothetical protein
MRLSTSMLQGRLSALLTLSFLCCGNFGYAQDKSTPQGMASGSAPLYQMAERSVPVANRPTGPEPAKPGEHPLMPAVRWAYQGLDQLNDVHDYSATMVKRERIDGKLSELQYVFAKVRQKPFSVYLYFLDPPGVRGQEVIFIEGQNNGKMWAHGVGIQKVVGTVSLEPTGYLAMRGQRYPITELGMTNLLRRLIEVGERDSQYGECDVKFFQGAKINNRVCTCIQVTHPVARRNFLFHIARIFVDDELNLPVRYESYDWPTSSGAKPELMEEYTYLNVKLNNGFTDADFDIRNPNYQFNSK